MNIIELIKKIAPIAFSGIGVAIISFFFDLIIKKRRDNHSKNKDEDKNIRDNYSENTIHDITGNSNTVINNSGEINNYSVNYDMKRLENMYKDACTYINVDREKALKKFEGLSENISKEDFAELFYCVESKIGLIYGMKAFNQDKRYNCQMAIISYEKALSVGNKIDKNKICDDYHNLGNIYCMLGEVCDKEENTLKAIEYYNKSLDICSCINNKDAYGNTMGCIGSAYRSLSIDKEKEKKLLCAIDYFEKAEMYCCKGEHYAELKHNQALTYVDIFKIKKDEKYLEKAEESFNNALTFFTMEREPEKYAVLKNNMANLYRYMYENNGNKLCVENAIQCCKSALLIYTKDSYPQGYALCMRNLGNCFLELFQADAIKAYFEKSLEAYNKSLGIYTAIDDPLHYSYVQKSIGDLYVLLANVEEKSENLQQAISFYENALLVLTRKKYPADYEEVEQAKKNAQIKLNIVEKK